MTSCSTTTSPTPPRGRRRPATGRWWTASTCSPAPRVTDARSIPTGAYEQDWSNYTLELDARKTAGSEGFLVGLRRGRPEQLLLVEPGRLEQHPPGAAEGGRRRRRRGEGGRGPQHRRPARPTRSRSSSRTGTSTCTSTGCCRCPTTTRRPPRTSSRWSPATRTAATSSPRSSTSRPSRSARRSRSPTSEIAPTGSVTEIVAPPGRDQHQGRTEHGRAGHARARRAVVVVHVRPAAVLGHVPDPAHRAEGHHRPDGRLAPGLPRPGGRLAQGTGDRRGHRVRRPGGRLAGDVGRRRCVDADRVRAGRRPRRAHRRGPRDGRRRQRVGGPVGHVQARRDRTGVAASVDAKRRVTLTATDQGSGVDRIEYRIGTGAWTTYTAPVQVGAAATTVEHRAVDKVGNVGATTSTAVPAANAVRSTTSTPDRADHRPTDHAGHGRRDGQGRRRVPRRPVRSPRPSAGPAARRRPGRRAGHRHPDARPEKESVARLRLSRLPVGIYVVETAYAGSPTVQASSDRRVLVVLP